MMQRTVQIEKGVMILTAVDNRLRDLNNYSDQTFSDFFIVHSKYLKIIVAWGKCWLRRISRRIKANQNGEVFCMNNNSFF